MLRNFFILLVAGCISTAALADQNKLLVQNYLNSFASRDAQGIFQLINWEGVDPNAQKTLQKQIKSSFKGRQIRRIYIEPVPADLDPSFVQDGKEFQFNLKPSGQLHIVYISNKGKRSKAQLLVGEYKGRLMIGNPVEVSATIACTNNADTQNKTKGTC